MRPETAVDLRRLAFGLLLLAGSRASSAESLTKEQLLSLVKEGVDTRVIVALVRKECVSFPIDVRTTLELSKRIPPEVLAAAIDCQGARPPRPDPTTAAPLPAPPPATPPGPQTPARLRLSASLDASEDSGYSQGAPDSCMLLVDYTGQVKVLKGGEGYAPHPGFRDELAGATVHEMPVPRLRDQGGRRWVDLPPGPHTISLFCRASWSRNDVVFRAEPGVDYRVLVRYGFGGRVEVAGVEPDR